MNARTERRWIASALLLGLGARAHAQGLVQKLMAPDGRPLDLFGASVALDGERALVGAFLTDDACGGETTCQSGSVYVFERRDGGFSFAEELKGSDVRRQDHFGSEVDVAGDLAVIATSANLDDPERLSTVYVFHRDDGAWLEVARLHAPDQEPGDGFGSRVATDGNRIAVGSPTDDLLGYTSTGSVWIFERVGEEWVATARLTAAVPDQRMHFGAAIALDGDRVLVGAPSDAHAGDYSGSAFTFTFQGGSWVFEQRLIASDADWYASFGDVVALEGDVAVVAARSADSPAMDAGAVYVFERDGATWSERARLQPHDVREELRFGWSLAYSRGTIVAGTPLADDAGFASGALWAFRRSDGRWKETARLRPRDGVAGDFLGQVLAFDGELALAGASAVDEGEATSIGAAYVFQIPAFATPFCECDSSAPCANQTPLGGCANSSGRGAELAALGTNALRPLDLQLIGTGLPGEALAIVCAGPPGPRLPFGDGWRCVGSSMLRLAAARANAGGEIAFTASDLSALDSLARTGSSWALQLAFDDPDGPCGLGANTSNALLVQF